MDVYRVFIKGVSLTRVTATTILRLEKFIKGTINPKICGL